ncbi:MAG: efflux RND transporter periplasmic adaptor subunit, partial [Planctomycetia bacterium]|nr:efflux RND transporter periplasmic adaptor subunit [Planctomycetia bacterium]
SHIVAPYDGVIVRKISEVGAFVSPGSPLVEIVSSGKIDAELQVSESFIDRLKVGDKVPIWIDSLNQETEGTIFSIVPYGSTAARSFPVRIRLDDQNGRLKVGMSVRGRLQITDAKDSIVVEKDAVLDRPDGALIWVVFNEKDKQGNEIPNRKVAQPVQVVITARTDTKYAVVPLSAEGRTVLRPGVDCVIEGADRLMVNEQVTVATVDPELMKNLPKASGHSIIAPVEDTPFFDVPDSQKSADNKDGASSNQTAPSVPAAMDAKLSATQVGSPAAVAASTPEVPVSDSTAPNAKDLRGKNE